MAQTKVITLDVPLRDPRVVSSSFAAAETLLEHEVALWNPGRISSIYDIGASYQGSPALTDEASFQLARDAHRRRRDFDEFLSLKRTLVVFVPEPERIYVATGERRNDGTPAKPRMKRIVDAFDISTLVPGELSFEAGSGASFHLEVGSPFADFWRTYRERFRYQAMIDGHDGRTLLTIAGTKRAVAAHAHFGGGHVWYLPALSGLSCPNHAAFLDSLLQLIGDTTGDAETPPTWASQLLVPKEDAATEQLLEAEKVIETAIERRDQHRSDLLNIQRPKALITASGRQLEDAVTTALRTLGADVEEGLPGRTDRILRWRDQVAVVEVKGLSKSAGEKDAAQLEKWVSAYIEEQGVRPRAILIVNAWRHRPLPRRTDPTFPEQMLPYATGREHCLVRSDQLLSATFDDDPTVFLDQVFASVGVLEGFEWSSRLTVISDAEEQ